MAIDTSRARSALNELDRKIASGRHGRVRGWGGAGVVVTPRVTVGLSQSGWLATAARQSFYPAPREVPTQYPRELSWLFKRLWADFQPLFGPVKEEFFGRLGNAANRYTRRTREESPRDLLGAVLHEAWVMLEEKEDGTFVSLPIAAGREIADDWIEEADREGYMTTEETSRWFSERGFE